MNAYQVLGIESGADERTIKRAYAALIKQYRPDTHPAEFAQVRAAYENVLHWLRENQQWEEQQQTEENVAEPVATVPVESAAEIAPESEPEQTAPQPAGNERNFISGQLSQLEEIAIQGNEQAILAKYREQSDLMAIQNLDLQLEYEHALLYWVLATQHPSLLVFAEANKRYDWVSDSIAICRRYGEYAGYRLAMMDKLLELYKEAQKQQNPFIKIKGEQEPNQHWLTEHYSIQKAKQLCSNWERECNQAGLSTLQNSLSLKSPRDIQVYWLDLFIGLAAAGIAWLVIKKPKIGVAWQWALIAGIVFACLPAVTKLAQKRIQTWSKLRKKKDTGQLATKIFLFSTVVIMFTAAGTGGAPAMIMALAIIAMPFIAIAIYDFLVDQEVKAVNFGKRLVQLILWIKMALLVLARNKLGLFNLSSESGRRHTSITGEPSLEQIKAQYHTGLKVTKQIIWAHARALPWWGWVVIIWFSITIVLSLLK